MNTSVKFLTPNIDIDYKNMLAVNYVGKRAEPHFIVANHIALITSADLTPAALLAQQLDTKVCPISANNLFSSPFSPPSTQTTHSSRASQPPFCSRHPAELIIWLQRKAAMIKKGILIKTSLWSSTELVIFLNIGQLNRDWPHSAFHHECTQTSWQC